MAVWLDLLQRAGLIAPPAATPLLEDRSDTAPGAIPEVERADSSIANALTGLGTAVDKGAAARPRTDWEPLDDLELYASYANNGLARRIVDLLPGHATKNGWTVDVEVGEEREADVARQFDEDLHVWARVREAWSLARLWRYAVIVIVTEDDIPSEFEGDEKAWQAEPLDLARVRKVLALQVYDCHEARPLTYNGDPRDPDDYRTPRTWQITPAIPGVVEEGTPRTKVVHGSRVLYFRGARRPPTMQLGEWGLWHRNRTNRLSRAETAPGPDDSVLRALWEALRNLHQTDAAGATLAQELREAVLQFGGMGAVLTGDQKKEAESKLSLMALGRRLLGLTVIGSEDNYTNIAKPPTGYKELSAGAQAALASVTGIPLSVLFGFAPSGLSTDDQSGWRTWTGQVSDGQKFELSPLLRKLYKVAIAADEGPTDLDGTQPVRLHLTYHPLDEPTAKEQAETDKLIADTDTAYINNGTLSPEQVQAARFGPESGSPFPQPEDLAPDLGPDDPDLPAEEQGAAPGPLPGAPLPAGAEKLSDVTANGAQFAQAILLALAVREGRMPRENAVVMLANLLNQPLPIAERMIPQASSQGPIAPGVADRFDALAVLVGRFGHTRAEAEGMVPLSLGEAPPPPTRTDAPDMRPPAGVREELRRGLRWHEEGHSGDGLVPATVAWARRLAAGEPITEEKVRKMRAWLARHEVDKQGEGFSPGEDGFPSPGRVAWALWGGDPAVTWSERLVAALDREKKDARALPPEHRRDAEGVGVWVGLPLPAEALGAWQEARRGVASVVKVPPQTLDLRGQSPHITLLWVGRVPREQVEAVRDAVARALDVALSAKPPTGTGAPRLSERAAIPLRGVGVGAFDPSEGSDGDTPLYLTVESRDLRALHERLAKEVLGSAERATRPSYRPHATVGYLPRVLTEAEQEALRALTVGVGEWQARDVHLSVGGEVWARWSLREAPRGSRSDGVGLTGPGGPDGHVHLLRPGAVETEPGGDDLHTHPLLPGNAATGGGGADNHGHGIEFPALPSTGA